MDTLGRTFVRTAKRRWSAFCMADSTGRELTYGRALIAALLLSRDIRRRVGERCVGLLLPASAGGALANLASSLAGKVPVNLNFTAGRESMTSAVERCEIRTILTSRVFLSKAGLEPMDGMVFLEDLLTSFGAAARAATAVAARVLPAGVLNAIYSPEADRDALATIIFSSGSTGVPKGVMLSHRNILSNIDSVARVFDLMHQDVMLGVLPFFHSFGFTGTLWLPLLCEFSVVYHPNPMDAKTIGELASKHKATVLISTPTFCLSYIRKIRPEQFATLRYAIVGAEKLREPIAAAFRDRFGLELSEGYGCTEMAPVVAVNVRPSKPGAVGRPLPDVQAKVVDVETGEGPLTDREGLLLVTGPNQMLGYLGEAERTRASLRDGWYVTGDIATIDADGFIRITDRLSRFCKIAGEMVPHMKVEEYIQPLLAEPHGCIVTSVPDDTKGERLVAFYTDPDLRPQVLWERLGASSLPKLWIPKREDLRFIEAIPTLGTGKVDLRAVRQFALPADNTEEQPLPGGREERLQQDVGGEAGTRGERERPRGTPVGAEAKHPR
jgi:acyl-[acyl-carrier-protein]-phospholipid O-acyltransferase / long-chain-fatty-acid--[acyl-carrier-protein] ligase